MTWKELLDLISDMPDEVMGYTACVWMPSDYVHPTDDFARVTGVQGFDADIPIGEDNLPSIEIEEG